MRVIVIGANGQLGVDVCQTLSKAHDIVPLTHEDIELCDAEQISHVLRNKEPEAVVNTAAFHNVPVCQTNPEQAFAVNAIGAKTLAEVCAKINASLVHISTDYVFDGQKKQPYLESDLPRPLNVYAISKLAGEHFIQAEMTDYFIMRSSGLYGLTPCRAKGGNFVDKMLELAESREFLEVVGDEVLTPTFTQTLAEQIQILITTNEFGLYHATNEGECSWYEFAKKIFQLANIEIPVHEVTSARFPSPVQRPSYSVLENHCLKEINLNQMPHWEDALRQYLHQKLV